MQWWVSGLVVCAFGAVSACGKVEQAPGSSGKTLCFDYYQRCVNRTNGTHYQSAHPPLHETTLSCR